MIFSSAKKDNAGNHAEHGFALAITFLYLLIAGIAIVHHEMWRDELQPWLIARNTESPLALFHAIRYEGHPFLWFLVVWPFSHLTDRPEVIQLLNVLIAGAAVYIVAAFAPVSRWIRAALALGYFPLYEYGAIARNYSLGLLAIVSFCALLPYRRTKPLLIGFVLFLAANTSLHACILSIAAVAVLMIETFMDPPEKSSRIVAWSGIALAAAGILFSVLQMNPPADTGYSVGWNFTLNAERVGIYLQTVTHAYLPLGPPGPGFWEKELLASFSLYDRYSWIASLVLLAVISLSLVRHPAALAYYLIGSSGLLLFFYIKHGGYLRHHGFLFISLCTALWAARTTPMTLLPDPLDRACLRAERWVSVLMPFLLCLHVAAAFIAVEAEYRHVFSSAKSVAGLIRRNNLAALPLVADEDMMTISVVGYLNNNHVFYPAGNRYGSYVVLNKEREIRYDVWTASHLLTREKKSPVIVLVDKHTLRTNPPPDFLKPRLNLVGCSAGEIVPDESYCVFFLPNKVDATRKMTSAEG